MSFSKLSFTNAGRSLQAKALTGTALVFTKIALGSGSLNGRDPSTFTNLLETKVSLSISKITRENQQVTLESNFSNQDKTTGFYWREVGLFANDPTLGEILYCYGNADTLAEYIPPSTSSLIEKVITLTAVVGNAQNVTATINTAAFATKIDYDKMSLKFTDYETQLATKVTQGSLDIQRDMNKNLSKIDQTMLSDTLLQQIAGTTPVNAVPANNSLTTAQYIDKSITPAKTDFVVSGINKLNITDRVINFGGLTITISDGVVDIDGTWTYSSGNNYVIISDTQKIVSEGNYVMSSYLVSGSYNLVDANIGLGLINSSPNTQYANNTLLIQKNSTYVSQAFTVPSTATTQYLWLVFSKTKTQVFNHFKFKIQIAEGTTLQNHNSYELQLLPTNKKKNIVNKVTVGNPSENVDFTNLRVCLEKLINPSENNQYEVYINEGTYDIGSYYTSGELSAAGFVGLTVPDYVTLIGTGRNENTILTMTFATANQYVSTLNLKGTSGLKNLTIVGNKTRYAIHDDFQGIYDIYYYRNIENCIVKAVGTYYNCAYGSGSRSGAVWSFKHSLFVSDGTLAFGWHSQNITFTIPGDITFEDCTFQSVGATSVKLGGMNSGVKNKIYFKGCTLNGLEMREEIANSGSGLDFEVYGHGNTKDILYTLTVTDGKDYFYNFREEVKSLYSVGAIAKWKPILRTQGYIGVLGTSPIYQFCGITIETIAANSFGRFKNSGYIRASDVGLSISLGDKIGIVNGNLAVVTSGNYIGICDVTGYFRLLNSYATI